MVSTMGCLARCRSSCKQTNWIYVTLLTGRNCRVQAGWRAWRSQCLEPSGNTVITARKSELTAYSGSRLVLLYGWWSWCMGPFYAQNSHSLSAKWWIASILWAIGKDRGTQDLISTPLFHFLHFGTFQINCIVFIFALPFPSFLLCPSIYRSHCFCVTFNELKGMQGCTGNPWQSTFERLRLTNGTVVSRWLCLPPFSFSASVQPSERLREWASQSRRD